MSDLVKITRKRPITTSVLVAEKFGKKHKSVLRAIENLECSAKFTGRNFALSKYQDSTGRTLPMFEMTKDGFVFLVMGFRGKKAAVWKEKYISAFNQMEQIVLQWQNEGWKEIREQGKAARQIETDAIAQFVAYAKAQGSTNAGHYYTNITKATYKALFLVKNKAPNNFRTMLDGMQLAFLQAAEYVARNALIEGMEKELEYKDIYILARNKIVAYAGAVGAVPLLEEGSGGDNHATH